MRKKLKIAAVISGIGLITLSFTGCALLPYSSHYSCPEAKSSMGNCSSLTANYKASLHPSRLKLRKAGDVNCPVSLKHTKACNEYMGSAKTKISGNKPTLSGGAISVSKYLIKYMLKTSTPPLYIPATIRKIWILPYSSKNTFHGGQDIFVIVRRGKWLYGNYLYKKYNKLNMFKVLLGK